MLEGTLFAGRCSLKKKAASLKLQAASLLPRKLMTESFISEGLHAYCLKQGYIFLKLIIRHQNKCNINDFYIAVIWVASFIYH
jgi:hypothetical protein